MDFSQFLIQLSTEFTLRINSFLSILHKNITPLIGALVVIYIASKVYQYYSNLDKGLDPLVVIRPCIILALIVLYEPIVNFFLIKPTRLLNDLIVDTILQVSGGNITAFNSKFSNIMVANDPNIFNALQINPMLEFLHLIIYFVAGFVANYMLLRQVINLAIYHILGYFSIIFSLIPGNENALKTWILTYLSILLWAPFIFIIKYLAILTQIDATNFKSFLAIVAVQVSLIFLFTKVPAFCETLVNTGNPISSPISGSPINKVGQIAGGMKKGVRGMMNMVSKTRGKTK